MSDLAPVVPGSKQRGVSWMQGGRGSLLRYDATKEKSHLAVAFFIVLGGDGGIRTHDTGISRMHP